MFKKNKSSGAAVPGTVSSATAQGVLPHYAGHATASLTPTIASTSFSPKDSSRKIEEPSDVGFVEADEERKVENRPPVISHKSGSFRRGGC